MSSTRWFCRTSQRSERHESFDTCRARGGDLRTVQKQDVYVDRERDKLQINNSRVSGQVIRTDNGVIYVVDSVLLPQYR